jgi:hypothetical protein
MSVTWAAFAETGDPGFSDKGVGPRAEIVQGRATDGRREIAPGEEGLGEHLDTGLTTTACW